MHLYDWRGLDPIPGHARALAVTAAAAGLLALATAQPAAAFVDDPLDRFAQISTGNYVTCGVTRRGEAWCWGYNYYGQVGDGTNVHRNRPVRVNTTAEGFDSDNIASISVGRTHSCAVTTAGQAFCWGFNQWGQLGNGTFSQTVVRSPQPVDTTQPGFGADNIASISVATYGWHTCALTTAGQAFCWGRNLSGALGDGSTTDAALPQPVNTTPPGFGASNITAVSAGERHSCALNAAGRAFCWGSGGAGALGDGSRTDQLVPIRVETQGIPGFGTRNIAAISAGNSFTCAVTTAGQAFCWGTNVYGELGAGLTTSFRSVPTPVATVTPGFGPANIAAISTGGITGCALNLNNRAFCWGRNSFGAVGDGTTTVRREPRRVNTTAPAFRPNNILQIAAGDRHSCALNVWGRPYCWGYNLYGQLGLGDTTDRNRPFPVAFDPSPPPPPAAD